MAQLDKSQWLVKTRYSLTNAVERGRTENGLVPVIERYDTLKQELKTEDPKLFKAFLNAFGEKPTTKATDVIAAKIAEVKGVSAHPQGRKSADRPDGGSGRKPAKKAQPKKKTVREGAR